jgi:PDZ domain
VTLVQALTIANNEAGVSMGTRLACLRTIRALVICLSLGLYGLSVPADWPPFEKNPGLKPGEVEAYRANPAPDEPKLINRTFTKSFLNSYLEEGYTAIGFTVFWKGGTPTEDRALHEGKALGADLVVIGRTTDATPEAHAKFSYAIIYLFKRRWPFGAIFEGAADPKSADSDDAERKSLHQTPGVYVQLVVKDSPAAVGGIVVGDVITKIDGTAVDTALALDNAILEKRGRTVKFEVVHDGHRLIRSVSIGQ